MHPLLGGNKTKTISLPSNNEVPIISKSQPWLPQTPLARSHARQLSTLTSAGGAAPWAPWYGSSLKRWRDASKLNSNLSHHTRKDQEARKLGNRNTALKSLHFGGIIGV